MAQLLVIDRGQFLQEATHGHTVLAVRGQIQEAIQVALDKIFTRSVATNLGWRDTFAQAQFADIVADSRVQAAMRRWEGEEEALRTQVRSYLADLQASS